jgi:hypothetical protein
VEDPFSDDAHLSGPVGWPAYDASDPSRRHILHFTGDKETVVETESQTEADRCKFWSELAPALRRADLTCFSSDNVVVTSPRLDDIDEPPKKFKPLPIRENLANRIWRGEDPLESSSLGGETIFTTTSTTTTTTSTTTAQTTSSTTQSPDVFPSGLLDLLDIISPLRPDQPDINSFRPAIAEEEVQPINALNSQSVFSSDLPDFKLVDSRVVVNDERDHSHMEVSRGQWPPPSPSESAQRRRGQQLAGPPPERVTYTLSVGPPSSSQSAYNGLSHDEQDEDDWSLFRPDEAKEGNSPIFVAKGVFEGYPVSDEEVKPRRAPPSRRRTSNSQTSSGTYDPFKPLHLPSVLVVTLLLFGGQRRRHRRRRR